MTVSEDTAVVNTWWLVLMQGVASLVIGLLLLLATGATLTFVVFMLGIWWLIQGLFLLISIFIDSTQWGWKLVGGLLGVIAGILVLQSPQMGAVLVTSVVAIIIGVMGIIIGIMALIAAFKGGGWGMGILGAVSLVLGILIVFNPLVSAQVMIWLLAIVNIIGGIIGIVMAFKLR
jgi:uncharacterized membrane protein HdeD (DUF308 family)